MSFTTGAKLSVKSTLGIWLHPSVTNHANMLLQQKSVQMGNNFAEQQQQSKNKTTNTRTTLFTIIPSSKDL